MYHNSNGGSQKSSESSRNSTTERMSRLKTDLNEEVLNSIIGIDLGTTNCCVGTWRNHRVEIIPNNLGDRTTPSEVLIKKNEIVIGKTARNISINSKNPNIKNSKRLIGRYFRDLQIQKEIKSDPVQIEEDPYTKKPQYCIKVGNEEKKYFPEDISSMILKHLKKFSEEFIGKEVKKAVITVPAHFNHSQREATKLAAEKAGLEVIRLINEPTAAAIAYGYENKSEEERKVLVFDLGGGTFDVSILKIKDEEFTVLASCGDPHLGGEDFTNKLTEHLIKRFKESNPQFKDINFCDKNSPKEIKVFYRVKKEAEKIKKTLSNAQESPIDLESLYGVDFYETISREEYEQLCSPMWERTKIYISKALKLSKLKKSEIDKIVLVGGSTRTPKIQKTVEDYFKEEEDSFNDYNIKQKDTKSKLVIKSEKHNFISKAINPDEAIAIGATIVACVECNYPSHKTKNFKINDITSKSIGIKTKGGKMEIIINKGTVLPVTENPSIFAKYFIPDIDNAKGINVDIYEGDNLLCSDNTHLYNFSIVDIPNDTKNNIIIKIIMSLDHNGVVTVTAKINDIKMGEDKIIKPSFSF